MTIAIIGGSGIYDFEGVTEIARHPVTTVFGEPSAEVVELQAGDRQFFFLPRHGQGHRFLPHEVNYRANILALKQLGATHILGISAVGSLREELAPGHFVIVRQYIDRVMGGRAKSFFGNGIAAHISTAQTCDDQLAAAITAQAKALDMPIHDGASYVCVDGPRLGTIAESHYHRDAMKADLVGMTNVPEAFLAKEAQMGYCTIGVVTDYDCWRENPDEHVSVEQVFARFGASIASVKSMVKALLESDLTLDNEARQTLRSALVTPYDVLEGENKDLVDLLLK